MRVKHFRLYSAFVRWFDKAFSGGWFRQVLFLAAVLLMFVLIWLGVLSLVIPQGVCKENFIRILELMLDPGAFVDSSEKGRDFPVLLQFIITISGAVFFTAMMITVLGNIVSNRIEDYKKGRVRYRFDDHILIIGADKMLVDILKEYANTGEDKGRKIVVLTSRDVEAVRAEIFSAIPEFQKKIDVTFLSGLRTVENTLRKVQIQDANTIYIIGEYDEPEHDALNLECWKLIRGLCHDSSKKTSCHLVVNRVSTFNVFQYCANLSESPIRLNIVNYLDDWAQHVLVSRIYETGNKSVYYPALDRDGIGMDSDKTVRFVIFGMTQMAYSMAVTAAHICHFPNFIKNPSMRTKICFVCPDIKQEMDFFVGRYANLFQLSRYSYIRWENGEMVSTVKNPSKDYGDFLDIEWSFIDSSIEREEMREMMTVWAENNDEILTMALCSDDIYANLSASLYLPATIYEKNIPVFVYQPGNAEVLRFAHEDSRRYSNVFPFGMQCDCFDPLFTYRLKYAKRINYLYCLQNTGQRFEAMCPDDQLNDYWETQKEYVYRFSNLFAANSIPMKLRSIGISVENMDDSAFISAENVDVLAEVEHNRWNIERLLLGFSAMTIKERMEINDMLSDKLNFARVSEGKRLKKEKQKAFIHKDVSPYSLLPESSKQYDKAIVCNLLEVIRDDI
ncbi:MAG: hypothetical protein ACI3ZL_06455 [Candidatus Cryptobacteroides sp.]